MKQVIGLVCVFLCLFITAEAAVVYPEDTWVIKVKWIDVGDKAISKYETIAYLSEASVIDIQKEVKSPVFYYFRGRLTSILQGHYIRGLVVEGKPYRVNAPENQALIKEYSSYYRKALDLDEKADASAHLTVDMLNAMASDVLAAPDIKERAYRKMIALIQASGDAVPDGYEYTTYQFLLESYSAQKNPDKYLATLNEMIDRFGSSEELAGYKRHVEEVIAKRDQEAAIADTYTQADTYVQPKAAAVQKPAKAIATQKPVAPKVSHETANTSTSDENTLLWWLLGGGALLALGGLYISRRKKG